MKLTNNDKEILIKWGYREQDMRQIEEATTKTIYTDKDNKRISAKKAIELLGRETYLNGISRSAFHWSSLRNIENSDNYVYFDSSKLFD